MPLRIVKAALAAAVGVACVLGGVWFVSRGLEGYETGIFGGPSGGGNDPLLVLGVLLVIAAPFVVAAIVRPPRAIVSRLDRLRAVDHREDDDVS